MADTLASILARADDKPAVRKFGVTETKLAEVIVDGLAAGELVLTDETQPTGYPQPLIVPDGVKHVVFDTTAEGGISSITTPADTTKVSYLQVTNAGSNSVYLYFDDSPEAAIPGTSTFGVVELSIQLNAPDVINQNTDCELKAGRTIQLMWSPHSGLWSASVPNIATFQGI